MKKVRLLFLMSASCFLLLCACSQKEDIAEDLQKSTKVAIDLQIANPMATQTKAGALDGDEEEVQYCDATIPSSGKVKFSFTVSFDGNIAETYTDETYEYTAANLSFDSGEGAIGTLSKLFLLEFPAGATKADVTVTDFRVYDMDDKLLFLTPKAESAYAGYVSTAVDYSEEVDMYEKQYIKMDVLCFNQEVIPEFGFTWFDFNVVTGDEICVFFNCLGSTAADYHQVYAADFEAKFLNAAGQWITYWEGSNYGVTAADKVAPMCIPCPGNWQTEGLKLDIFPQGETSPLNLPSSQDATLTITPAQIEAFLSSTTSSYGNILEDGDDYEMEITLATGEQFMHFTLAECNE